MEQPNLPGLPVLPSFATDNPREIRIICALAGGTCSREELYLVAGSSNVPDAIAALRRKGLEIPCCRTPVADSDGEVVYRGRYSLTESDRERTAGSQTAADMNPALSAVENEIHIGKPSDVCASCRKPFGTNRKPYTEIRLWPSRLPIPIAISCPLCRCCAKRFRRGHTDQNEVMAAIESFVYGEKADQ